MPKSMTGFGVADGPLAGGRIHVEIRTVNHRHFNVQLRLAPSLHRAEDEVRAALRRRITRGHVAVSARWTTEPTHATEIAVDVERARAIMRALDTLKDALDLRGDVDVGFVARQPDVLRYGNGEREIELAELMPVVNAALDGVIAMREREGAALADDLTARLAAIDERLARVRARAPARVTAERDRLRAAVGELLEGRAVDEDRLAQELAYLAERLDVSEELVRLAAHLQAARDALGQDEASGRALGFLAQEMLREINTIGSKANDAEIAAAVIEMKGELEKFREQLENIE